MAELAIHLNLTEIVLREIPYYTQECHQKTQKQIDPHFPNHFHEPFESDRIPGFGFLL